MSQKLIGNLKKGLVFVLSAPAGTGKTTLVRMLTQEFSVVKESVSCTTRAPRAGEAEGTDYWFMSEEVFLQKKERGEFLECAKVFGFWYGTLQEKVEKEVDAGNHVFLIIDTQGAMQLQSSGFKAVYIFVAPPSLGALAERLTKRQTECEQKREERLSWAEKELLLVNHYDFQIVNCSLEVAYAVLRSIVIAEEHRVL
jgi:guanylate kinase